MSLLVQELFDYTAQNLHALNGGTGWSAAWVTDQTGTEQGRVVSDNLTYAGVSNGSPANNSRMLVNNEGDGGSARYLYRDFTGIPNTVNGAVYWFAFNIASNLAKGDSFLTLNKLTTDSGGSTPKKLLAWDGGLSAAEVAYSAIGGTTLYTGSSSYVAHNIVVKIVMSGAALTKVATSIFVDVDMNTDPAGWSAVITDNDLYVASNITRLRWDSETAASSSSDDLIYMDNIRWATTSYEAGGYSVPSASNSNFFLLF